MQRPDRGMFDSIYFTKPQGLLIELATYKFEPPTGFTHVEAIHEAHKLRVARVDYNIEEIHMADAIEMLVERRNGSLSAGPSLPSRDTAPADRPGRGTGPPPI
jgi:glyoxalase family protein